MALVSNPHTPRVSGASSVELASRSYSMENRYNVASVNEVFRDNILLTLRYMDGDVKNREDISWPEVEKPFQTQFTLKPGEGFAFHDQVLPEYSKTVVKTTNAHFNSDDGFKSDGYLVGDGVCHLASFIHWVALDAGLTSVSLARHDFAKINDVPREYGVSIRFMPGAFANSSRQNLYIVNNKEKPITFIFNYDGTDLSVGVLEDSGNS
ncbi:MAG: VanW family protein [Candidatus Woesebacteria bacterium]|nr:MAG: VanW family protein [Candidatus Woesebacteria bacterium]